LVLTDSFGLNPKAVSFKRSVKRIKGQIKVMERAESCQKNAANLELTLLNRFHQRGFVSSRSWDHIQPDTTSRIIRIVGYSNTASSETPRKLITQWIRPVAQLDRESFGGINNIIDVDESGLYTDKNDLIAMAGYSYSSFFSTM
jgi:hypothetical protein